MRRAVSFFRLLICAFLVCLGCLLQAQTSFVSPWSFAAPGDGQIVTSPDGSRVGITTYNCFQMLGAGTYNLQWSRNITNTTAYFSVLLPQNQYYALFTPDSKDVWLETTQDGTSVYFYEFVAATGAPVLDQNGNSKFMKFAAKSFDGAYIFGNSQHGEFVEGTTNGYQTFDLNTYTPSTGLAPLCVIPETVQTPTCFGNWTTSDGVIHDVLGAGSQMWDLRNQSLKPLVQLNFVGSGTSSYPIGYRIGGFDPGGGVIVTVSGDPNYGVSGTYRLNSTLNESWFVGSQYSQYTGDLTFPQTSYFLNYSRTWQQSSEISAINWSTGVTEWSYAPPQDDVNFWWLTPEEFFPNGHALTILGPTFIGSNPYADFQFTSSGVSGPTYPNIPLSPINFITATADGLIVAGGGSSSTYVGLQSASTGKMIWSDTSGYGNSVARVSQSGAYVAVLSVIGTDTAVYTSKLSIFNEKTGAQISTITYPNANLQDLVWIGDTGILIEDSSFYDYYYSVGTGALSPRIPPMFYPTFTVVAETNSSGGTNHFAVGFSSNALNCFPVDAPPPYQQTSSVPITFNESSFGVSKIVPLSNGEVACFAPITDSGNLYMCNEFQWTTYKVSSSGILSLDKTYTYNFPETFNTTSENYAHGDFSSDGKLMAFAIGHGADNSGAPLMSDLVIERTSDGAVLEEINPYFTAMSVFNGDGNPSVAYCMSFSPDHSQLYVCDLTGTRITTLTVPNWVDSISAPASVGSGATVPITINLGGPAGSTGQVVLLASSPTIAGLPASITVPAGSSSFTTNIVAPSVTAAATYQLQAWTPLVKTKATTRFTVNAPSLTGLTFNPAYVLAGSTSIGTLTFSGVVPAGATVTLSSSNSQVTVPSTVTFAAAGSALTFTAGTAASTTSYHSTITATALGASQTATLSATPTRVSTFTIDQKVAIGGETVAGTVSITSPAPFGGLAVTLSSSSPSVSVPTTVTIPYGSMSADFSFTTVPVTTSATATLTAEIGGSNPKTTTLTVNPPTILDSALEPDAITAGGSTTLAVLLSGPAAQGAVLQVTSDSSRVTVSPTLTMVAGVYFQTFSLTTTGTGRAVAHITVSYNGTSSTSTLTITP